MKTIGNPRRLERCSQNRSDADFARVPVDLELANGGRTTVLVAVRGGHTVDLEWQE